MKRISSCVVLMLFYFIINASQRSVNFSMFIFTQRLSELVHTMLIMNGEK